jgi:hypothetical protein
MVTNEEILKLARSQKTSSAILMDLIGHNVETDRLLSKHMNVTPKMLSHLATCDDHTVCRNVVKNASTPVEVLLWLGPKYPAELFKSSNLDAVLILDKKIPDRFQSAKFINLLSHENVPDAIVNWILKSGTSEQQASYLFGCVRPDKVMRKFRKSKHYEITIALLERSDSIYIDWAKQLGWVKSTTIEKNQDEMSVTARMQIDEWLSHKNRQLDGLWKSLVPKEGEAATVQGELVRSIVRIQNEFYRNGMMNWGNGFYEGMASYISRILKSDKTFGHFAKKCIDADIMEIQKSGETGEEIAIEKKPRSAAFGGSILLKSRVENSHNRLAALIAIWCEKHVEPINNPHYVYPRDRIVQLRSPDEYLSLNTPCPKCGGFVRESDLEFCCVGKVPVQNGCGFAFDKSPDGRGLFAHEAEKLLSSKKLGPLEGFKTKNGLPFKGNLVLKLDDVTQQFQLLIKEYSEENINSISVDFSTEESLGICPKCGGSVFPFLEKYVCEKSVQIVADIDPSCDFNCGQSIMGQHISSEQFKKLISVGATDVLEGFFSRFSKKLFKARLVLDTEKGDVSFDFINDDK